MSRDFAIEAQGVTVALGGERVLDRLSVGFRPGEVTAIVGPNGAGKTTLLKALLRLLPLETGAVSLFGEEITARKPHQLAGRIGYLEQAPRIYWPLTAAALVGLSLAPGGDVAPALARTGVGRFRDRSVLRLSGGERARVLLARVLAAEAPVILADEPTLSLDPRHQIAILECFRAEAGAGRCCVLVMHDLRLAEKYADRIVVLDAGAVVRDAPAPDALDGRTLSEVFGIARDAIA